MDGFAGANTTHISCKMNGKGAHGFGLQNALQLQDLRQALRHLLKSAFDPLVLTLAAAAVLLLAVGASTPPARRAASIDPMQALRME